MNRVIARLVFRFVHRPLRRVRLLPIGGLANRPANRVLLVAVLRLVDRAVAGLRAVPDARMALFAVAGLADLLVDGLLDRLVGGVPALFDDVVPDQLVAGVDLLLTGRETGLRIATGLRTAAVAWSQVFACQFLSSHRSEAGCLHNRRSASRQRLPLIVRSFSISLDFGAADRNPFSYIQLYEDGASRYPGR